MEFIGIDLAWKVDPPAEARTGVVALNDDGSIVDADLVTTDEQIYSFCSSITGDKTVAIDAPLSIPVGHRGKRICERILSRARIHAFPADPAFMSRAFGGTRGVQIARALGEQSYKLVATPPPGKEGRYCVEVFPRASILGLWDCPIAYKKGPKARKRVGLDDLRGRIGSLEDPGVDFTSNSCTILAPPVPDALSRELDQVGDVLDAILSAYTALLAWHCPQHALVAGDVTTGSILLGAVGARRERLLEVGAHEL